MVRRHRVMLAVVGVLALMVVAGAVVLWPRGEVAGSTCVKVEAELAGGRRVRFETTDPILLAVLLGYARILYSSGRDRTWPAPVSRALGRVHPRTRTPVVATLAIGVAALTLTAVSDYAAAVTFASLTVVVTFALIALSALVSRLLRPGLARPYRMPLWPLAPAVALAGVAVTVALQTGRDLAIVAGILVAGVVYDLVCLRPRRDTHWILLEPASGVRDVDP